MSGWTLLQLPSTQKPGEVTLCQSEPDVRHHVFRHEKALQQLADQILLAHILEGCSHDPSLRKFTILLCVHSHNPPFAKFAAVGML